MSTTVLEILERLDQRYPTDDERAQAERAKRELPARVEAAGEIAQADRKAVKHVIKQQRARYPKFHTFHEDAWGKATRDIQLVVTYQAKAMLSDDMRLLEDRVLVWLRTILTSFDMTPRFFRDTYEALRDGMRDQLSAESYRLLEPCLNATVETMSCGPEPSEPRV